MHAPKAVTVVTWKWGRQYGPEYVNRLQAAVARNLRLPHRFVCVTDDASGLASSVTVVQDPADHAGMRAGSRSCYRRLRMFDARWARRELGDAVLHLDLDTVVVGDVTPLVDRGEDLVVWNQPKARIPLANGYAYNPSVMLLRTGTHTAVWDEFHADPEATTSAARLARWFGTDMAVINLHLQTRPPGTWGETDGVLSWYVHIRGGAGSLPSGARIVNFHGGMDEGPGDPGMQRRFPWITEHW